MATATETQPSTLTPFLTAAKPTDLREGTMVTVSVLGISQRHELWVDNDEDGSAAYYVVVPDSGPVTWLKAWTETTWTYPTFHFDGEDRNTRFAQQVEAERWVMEQAHEQIRQEWVIDPELADHLSGYGQRV